MHLVIGPTSAGKSTYIKRLIDDHPMTVHRAHELQDRPIPTGPEDLVHYNLLRGFRKRPQHAAAFELPSLLTDLVAAADEITVLIAPVPVLVARAQERSETDAAEYSESWVAALGKPKLAQLCELLALHIDQTGKPHRYLCSNAAVHGDYVELSRWHFPRMASKDAEKYCVEGHPAPDLEIAGHTYQRDYQEGAEGAKRGATLARALTMPLAGKRLLDIGCAEGAAALSAARMGAKVTGVEPRKRRFTQLTKIAGALGAELDLRNMTLDGVREKSDAFDVVLCLNVAHHVPHPFAFLDRAADLASSYLVLEYPGLADRKFQGTLAEPVELSDEQPLLGVSTPGADQTFVFTPAALERYFVTITGVFAEHRVIPSPIPDRWISIFSDKQRPVAESAEARLRTRLEQQNRRVRQLEQRVAYMEASRSWRVTAPLRKLRAR